MVTCGLSCRRLKLPQVGSRWARAPYRMVDRYSRRLRSVLATHLLYSCKFRPLATASFFTKCTILHLGRNNTLPNYSVNNVSVPDATVVTDLGVLVDINLRFTKHYRSIVNKDNHRSSLILKSLQSRNPQLLLRAFTVLVRPLLDYCSPVWASVYETDINLIERVLIVLLAIFVMR